MILSVFKAGQMYCYWLDFSYIHLLLRRQQLYGTFDVLLVLDSLYRVLEGEQQNSAK